MSDEIIFKAADDLESLVIEIHQAILDMRANTGNKAWHYWQTYQIRSKLNRIVATLGAGVPPRRLPSQPNGGKQVFTVGRGELLWKRRKIWLSF